MVLNKFPTFIRVIINQITMEFNSILFEKFVKNLSNYFNHRNNCIYNFSRSPKENSCHGKKEEEIRTRVQSWKAESGDRGGAQF